MSARSKTSTNVRPATPAKAKSTRSRARKPRESIKDQARQLYRDAIISAGERVFGRRGFGDTRMADVAREAGLGIGTLYNYFDNKAELFSSLLESRAEQFFAALQLIVVSERPPREKLRELVRASLAHIEQHHATYNVLLEVSSVNDSEVRRACGEATDKRFLAITGLYAQVLGELPIPPALGPHGGLADLAAILTGAMHGTIRNWYVRGMQGGDKGSLADKADLIVAVFLDGVTPRS